MARVRFKQSTTDHIKRLFVKKKTFRVLVATQISTLLLLAAATYKLHEYGFFGGK